MVNLVSRCCRILFANNVSYMGGGIPKGHDNKISRPSASFMNDRTQLKFKNHWFLRLQTSTLCQDTYIYIIFIHQVIDISSFQNGLNNPFYSIMYVALFQVVENSYRMNVFEFWGNLSQIVLFWGCDNFSRLALIQPIQFYQW